LPDNEFRVSLFWGAHGIAINSVGANGWACRYFFESMRIERGVVFAVAHAAASPFEMIGAPRREEPALAGDAVHAPSFLSGQGASLALVGAYVLAGELANHDEPERAFATCEQICRAFVEAKQAPATRGGHETKQARDNRAPPR
jgi:2-polyprenyl-6-methoxyphenol hydroxylase-like FAD-dependent oxidoreductase